MKTKLLLFLFCIVSKISFTQEEYQVISVDSLKKYLVGTWKIEEWRCWDQQFKDTIIKEASIIGDTLYYTEKYDGVILKQVQGPLLIEPVSNWFRILIHLDKGYYDENYYNAIELGIGVVCDRTFKASWSEEFFYKNLGRQSTHNNGQYYFTRKE